MNSKHSEHHPIIIIGAGAAGLTAAIYTARAHLNPLVIQGPQLGGQLVKTTDVENYPGFEKGILGPELMRIFQAQAKRFGTQILQGTVTAVDLGAQPFCLTIDDQQTLTAQSIIIATGASPRKLGLEHEERLTGRGISYCTTCDASFFNNEAVAVVGGGDTAMEDALFLTRFASHVSIIHRRNKLRASKIMQHRAFSNDKISFVLNTELHRILGDDNLEGVQLRDLSNQTISHLDIKGLFIAIGYQPNTKIFQNWLDMNDFGYIRTQCDSTKTSLPGVFACGDVQDWNYRQAITAAGTGCMAAIDAEQWLQAQGHVADVHTARWSHPASS